MTKKELKLREKWNTVSDSELYYMNGRFYLNRNPYGWDKGVPKDGIPYDIDYEISFLNMSDLHSTVCVLGFEGKIGIFPFEYGFGMQAFRYASDEEVPFPFDEVWTAYRKDDESMYFAVSKGGNWGILKLGSKDCPYERLLLVPILEKTRQEAINKIADLPSNIQWKNIKDNQYMIFGVI